MSEEVKEFPGNGKRRLTFTEEENLRQYLEKERIGVFICHCGTNIAGTIDIDEVVNYAKSLPGVAFAGDHKYMCSDPGQNLIKEKIKELGLTRVVVSSCSPLMHELTFRHAVADAGLNEFLFQMANIREQVSWVTIDKRAATEKAKRLIRAAVTRVVFHKPLEVRKVPVNPNTLVVGGGIAGIESALKLSEGGHKVYLVEKEPSIGGHMAKFDKTFPTLDCAACILTPKMVSVGRSENIELLTYSEVEEVSGYVGNFKVKVRKKARYVNLETCTACQDCVAVCPVRVPDEFNQGMSERTAIYRQFAQATPNKFLIDKRGPAPCKVACPIEQDVPGYLAMIAEGKYKEAVEIIRRANPLPVVCAYVCYHPCEEWCERKNVDEPLSIRELKRFAMDWAVKNHIEMVPPPPLERRDEKVAIVGAGAAGLASAYVLAQKGYQVEVYEASSVIGGMMALGLPPYRMPRQMLKHDINYIEKMGVKFNVNQTLDKDFTIEDLKNRDFQAIILAVGTHRGARLGAPGEDLPQVEQGLDFLKRVNLGEQVRVGKKVCVIGGGNTAIDVARTALRLGAEEVTIVYRRSKAEMPASGEEFSAAEEEGVKFEYLTLPIEFLADENGSLRGMTCVRMELGEPDESGRRRPIPVKGSEFFMDADNVYLAIGLVPATDYFAGSEDMKLDKWNAPIVQTGSWETSIPGVFAAGDLVTGPSTIVKAMRWGKQVANAVDKFIKGLDYSSEVTDLPDPSVLRRNDFINPKWRADYSNVPHFRRSEMPMLAITERIRSWECVELGFSEEVAREEARRCLQCGVCVECWECVKACQPKAIDHFDKDEVLELEVGNIILATGFKTFDAGRAKQFGYGRYDNVLTSLDFERLSHSGGPTGGRMVKSDGTLPKAIAILHCIGSRDQHYNEYCSRVCCMYSLKMAHLIKEKIPDCEVYELYIDMRCFGKGYEEFYNRLLHERVHFIRGKGAEVNDYPSLDPTLRFEGNGKKSGKLFVRVEDTLLGIPREIPVDMVILSVGLESSADAGKLQQIFKLSRSKDGFFLEKHPKLAPVNTASDGIFIAGCAQGPKDIPDSVAQGAAASASVMALINTGEVVLEPTTSHIDEEICTGCKTCITVCPYDAIFFEEVKKISVVNEALCKGCGTCVSACPSGAARQWGFDDIQIESELSAILKEYKREPEVTASGGQRI